MGTHGHCPYGSTFLCLPNGLMQFLSFLMSKKRKEREEKSKVVRILLLSLAGFAGVVLLFGVIGAFLLLKDLPDIGDLDKVLAESTVILDREGNELYKVFGEENRVYVPLERISKHFLDAIIAAEDRKFYTHPGVDIIGIFRAQISNWRGNSTQGASTLSQQLVKNLVLKDKSQSYIRKLREAVLAYQLEQKYSKSKILELYVNQSPFGGNAYGIEMAARMFFAKEAKDLTIGESAVLASLPKGPALYSPFGQNVDLLMGYCSTGAAGNNVGEVEVSTEETGSEGEVVVTAREKVWLKVAEVSGGKVAFEGTLEKGDERSFPGDQSYVFSTGNKNFDVYVAGKAIELPKEKTFTLDPKAVAVKNDGEAPEKPQSSGNLAKGCSSMDDPKYVIGRKDFVLQSMMEEGFITKEERDKAWQEANTLTFKRARENIVFPHFVMFVREYLEKKYGEDVGTKGYIVKTTIDPKLQVMAQDIVKQKGDSYAKNSGIDNAALVSVDPTTGEILAMVGSRDYWDEANDGNVNVTVRKRQPGSSFKPFIFAQLFEGNWGAGSVLWDVKTRFGGSFPNNYDGGFMGPMTVRKALAYSRNIPPIKAYHLNDGEEKTLEFLAKMGFGYLKEFADTQNEGKAPEDKFYYGYPIAIGAGEVRPLDMAAGYAIFANGGTYLEPTPILEIKTSDGEVIERLDTNRGKTAIDPQVAYQITSILSDANARPGGFWRNALATPGVITAAKTGTSNKRFGATIYPSDLWTVGYSRSLVTAVWVGNMDGSKLKQGQDGLNFAAPIWKDFMLKAHTDREKGAFIQPKGIVKATVSTLSGKLAAKGTPPEFTTTDIFSSWAVPKEYDQTLVGKKVDRRNGLLAGEGCDEAIVETVYVYNVHSERPNLKAWEDPVRAWAAGRGFASGKEGDEKNVDVPKDMSDCKPVSASDTLSVSIGYPRDAGLVQAGPVSVDANINAPFGLSKVEYYLNGVLATTRTAEPFTSGTVTIPGSGATHAILVIAYDKNGKTAQSSIAVKTGQDSGRPQVSISGGGTVALGGSLSFQVTATDADSPLRKVDVYVGNSLVKSVGEGTHTITVPLPAGTYPAGSYAIKAFATDSQGNTASTTGSFTVSGSAAVSDPAPTPSAINSNGESAPSSSESAPTPADGGETLVPAERGSAPLIQD